MELADGLMRERTSTRPKSARFDWGENGSRVHVAFDAVDPGKSRLALSHARLADGEEAERMKALLARAGVRAEGGAGAMSDLAITEVGTVIVPVADQDRALEFWTGLGFETRIDGAFGEGQRWLEVAPPGAATSIALVAAPEDAAAGTEVSFTTTDAAADHAALRARGVDADEELIVMGDYVPPMFTFRDPDGNGFRVVERPSEGDA